MWKPLPVCHFRQKVDGMKKCGISAAFTLIILLLLPLKAAVAEDVGSIDESPSWRLALGGKIDSYAAQGPGGDVYIVADDRALHSLNPLNGESKWIYRPGGRLRDLLIVAPDGTIYVQNDRQELFAVTPGGTGRWKLKMGAEPSSLPAAAPDGRIILPLAGGRIVCTSRHGVILWNVDEVAEASAAPVVSSDGLAWIPLSDGRIIALNQWGEPIASGSMPGAVSILTLDNSGRVWAGGFDGRVTVLPVLTADTEGSVTDILYPDFEIRPGSSRVSSILTDPESGGQVFLADGSTVIYDSSGNELERGRIAVSGGAPSASADGTVFAPASDGSIRIVYPDGSFGELRGASVLAEPLLTAEGMLISGGGDWILYAWNAGEPGPGWRQFRGGPLRNGTFPSLPVYTDRREARRDPGFFFRERIAVSDDLAERMALIKELESYPDDHAMRRELPWVDLILEDLVSVGTIRSVNLQDEPLMSQPTVRASAYLLMARGEDFRSRELILECLRNEYDPVALAAGFRALGLIGSDWDGASMRTMARGYQRLMPADEHLTLETARALADLVRYNGDLSDTAGFSLMDNLLRSGMSASARAEVIAIIRGVAGL